MSNLKYTELKNVIKKDYNINVDDLPVYKIGILKYFYKQIKLSSTMGTKTFHDYIKEVIKNEITSHKIY